MGNPDFGIFAVANAAATAGHSFVLRMTNRRFEFLHKKATLVECGDNFPAGSHQVRSHRWRTSTKERSNHPGRPPDSVLEMRLHEAILHKTPILRLVNDLRMLSQVPSVCHAAKESKTVFLGSKSCGRDSHGTPVQLRNRIVLTTSRLRTESSVLAAAIIGSRSPRLVRQIRTIHQLRPRKALP